MSVVGKRLGSSLGAWLGAGGEPVASYVDAALFVVGAGSALLWPDVINRPPQPTTTGGTRRRRVTALPGWYVPKNPPVTAPRLTDEDEATLLCHGGL